MNKHRNCGQLNSIVQMITALRIQLDSMNIENDQAFDIVRKQAVELTKIEKQLTDAIVYEKIA